MKPTIIHLAEKESQIQLMCVQLEEVPTKYPFNSSINFCAFGLLKCLLGRREPWEDFGKPPKIMSVFYIFVKDKSTVVENNYQQLRLSNRMKSSQKYACNSIKELLRSVSINLYDFLCN